MSFTKYDYTVGWIAALPVELAAARGMMEKPLHPMLPSARGDTNTYTLGRIGHHNVVLVCLPTMGTDAAAHTAANLKRSFPEIRFSVMVGIGGGVPGSANADATKDVRLGDVVVSTPDRQHGGVIQYDFGTLLEGDDKEFIRKGHLNKPPSILINAVRDLQADTVAGKVEFIHHYHNMLEDHPEMASKFGRPEIDKLFRSDYHHQQDADDCRRCLDEGLLLRKPRLESVVHYGLIGSANRVLRSAMERDDLNNKEGVICFEMEAAGLMDEFSCIVIRGICDYCDSHKSKVWQPYASAMAAAFAKTLLLKVSPLEPEDDETLQQVGSISRQVTSNVPNVAANSIDSIQYRECLQALGCTHPRIDKRRLEDIKGGLLRDAYKWILATDEYNAWLTTKDSMWIKGDAGKGKTMLICGIIDETAGPLAYFFCQATLDTHNSAIQVLRGLIFSILDARRSASEVIYDKIQAAQNLPTGSAFYALGDVLEDLLAEGETILMVDALDECVSDLDNLLRLIVKTSTSDNCKWVVTSRNIPEIEEHLGVLMRLSLELNDESVSASVDFYIRYKVQQLSSVKKYSRVDADLEEYILRYLLDNAQGTFLWVSLVCQRLSKVKPYQAKTVVRESPRGLTELYQQMLDTIQKSEDGEIMKELLAIVSIIYRPVTLEELCTLLDLYKDSEFDQVAVLQDLVEACGCFLTVKESVVNLVHLSAKDFLTGPASADIHEHGEIATHRSIVRRSVWSLRSLKRNMYDLKDPSIEIWNISKPDPDPHAQIRYAITYWADHLLDVWTTWREAKLDMSDVALVDTVLSTCYLYWLESLCLIRQIHPVMNTMLKLVDQLDTISKGVRQHDAMTTLTSVSDRFRDALQFYRYFQATIVDFPMQLYVSGLLFCPQGSYIRNAFSNEMPTWATVKSGSKQSWSQGHSLDTDWVRNLVWSADDEQILTFAHDVICLWNASSGALLMSTHKKIEDLRFSEVVGNIVTLDSSMESVEILSASTGQSLHDQQLRASAQRLSRFDDFQKTPELIDRKPRFGVLSRCGKLVARAWRDYSDCPTITEIHVCETGQLLQVWSDASWTLGLCFAADQLRLAETGVGWVRIRNVRSGEIVWSADWDVVPTASDQEVMFSPCCKFIAICQWARIQIWDWSNKCSQHHSIVPSTELRGFRSSAFDADSAHIFVCGDKSVRRYTLEGQQIGSWTALSHTTRAIVVSESGTKIAIICYGDTKVCKVEDMVSQPVSTADTSHDVEFARVFLCKNWVSATINSDKQHNMAWSCRDLLAIDGTLDFGMIASSDILVLNQDRSMVASQSPRKEKVIVRDLVSSTNTEHYLLKTDANSTVVAFGPRENEFTLLDSTYPSFWSCSSHGVESDRWRVPYDGASWSLSTSSASWAADGLSFLVRFWDVLLIWYVNSRDWKVVKDTDLGHTLASFSPEGSMFAVCNPTTGLELFRTNNLERIFAIPVHGGSSSLIFEGIWLKTDTTWCKPAEGSFSPDSPLIIHRSNRLNIGYDGRWIRSGSQNLIWLPMEYRNQPWDANASLMILGLPQLRVVVLEIQRTEMQQI